MRITIFSASWYNEELQCYSKAYEESGAAVKVKSPLRAFSYFLIRFLPKNSSIQLIYGAANIKYKQICNSFASAFVML